MSISNSLYRFRYLLSITAMTLSLAIFAPAAMAKLFDGPVDKLPVAERVALKEGKVILTGERGEYVCRILVTSNLESAWQVLTDYDNYEDFIPGVSDSELVKGEGDRKILEQINQVKTLIFRTSARIRLAITESYPQQIAFDFVDGDLDSLDGSWLLEPVSPYPSAPPNQVLLTHRVNVEPSQIPSKSIFYNIYESRLEKTLAAIKEEVETRYIMNN